VKVSDQLRAGVEGFSRGLILDLVKFIGLRAKGVIQDVYVV